MQNLIRLVNHTARLLQENESHKGLVTSHRVDIPVLFSRLVKARKVVNSESGMVLYAQAEKNINELLRLFPPFSY